VETTFYTINNLVFCNQILIITIFFIELYLLNIIIIIQHNEQILLIINIKLKILKWEINEQIYMFILGRSQEHSHSNIGPNVTH
jgi:hypothetical protein